MLNRRILSIIGVFAVVTLCTADEPIRTCIEKVRIGRCGPTEDRPTFETFHHGVLDDLLGVFVDDNGMVCYGAWKDNCRAMDDLYSYLCHLGSVDTSKPSCREARLAFYINAYNALAIYGILREYPTPSIQKHNKKGANYRIFDDLELWIDGKFYSLNDIEHKILRPMGEPRIHFALVCAARGCPKLRSEAYHPEHLEGQLSENTVDFFASRRRFRVSRVTGKIWVSPILKWFAEDFGPNDNAVLARIFPYLPCDAQELLGCATCVKLRYLGYDWSLNDQCPNVAIRMARFGYGGYSRVEPVVNRFKKE